MKKSFISFLSVLCVLILGISAVSSNLAEAEATPTDLYSDPGPETLKEAAEEIAEETTEVTVDETAPGVAEVTADETAREGLDETGTESDILPQEEERQEQDEPDTALPEPAENGGINSGDENVEQEKNSASAEKIISRNVKIGDTWEGLTRDTIPAVLKLDLDQTQTVHILVQSRKKVQATVERSDRPETTRQSVLPDAEYQLLLISFEAEKGSSLITITPEEPNRNAKVSVSFLDNDAYTAWEEARVAESGSTQDKLPEPADEQEQPDEQALPEKPEDSNEETDAEPDAEPALGPENDLTDEAEPDEGNSFELPANRSANITISWDDPHPAYGCTAHFKAELTGYDDLDYSLQWQWSEDNEVWNDVTDAVSDSMDVVYSEENGDYQWRILVYIIRPDEE